MKKLFVFIIVLLLSGYSHQNTDDGVVGIWYYIADSDGTGTIETAVNSMEDYARKNYIKFEVTGFKSSEISYDDYVLKRNIAIENGGADIVLDDTGNLYSLKNVCGDYTRLEGYEDLFDGLKDRAYLPLVIRCFASIVNGDLFNKYNIEYKKVISYPEYYELKRALRNAGAIFSINKAEVKEILDSYMNDWNTYVEFKNNSYTVDVARIKSLLESIYDELKLPDGNYADIKVSMVDNYVVIRDEMTGIVLRDYDWPYGMCLDYDDVIDIGFGFDMPDNDVYLLRNLNDSSSNGFLITNKASKEAYEVASALLEYRFFRSVPVGCSPTVNTELARKNKEVDENWKYQGIKKDSLVGRSGSLSKEIFDAGYEKVLNGEFDLVYEDKNTKQCFRDFVVDSVAEMQMDGGKINNLDDRIKNFEINLNMK